MKHRLPTVEERKLWLESNRQTRRLREELRVQEVNEGLNEGIATLSAPFSQSSTPRSVHPSFARAEGAPTSRLVLLSQREAAKRFGGCPIEATLDLHGETKLDARELVQQFIHRQSHAHRRHVLIITGKGKGGVPGVLREYLPDWLNEPQLRPLLSAIAYAPPEKGGAGVMHVLLKPDEHGSRTYSGS